MTAHTLALILLAGGSSSRMGGPVPKPFMQLNDKKVIDYSIEAFSLVPQLQEICIVCTDDYRSLFPSTYTFANPGTRRQDSVYNGLHALKTAPSLVAVHDAARPLISLQTIVDVIEAAIESGGALAAVPVKSTIKMANDENKVVQTPNRAQLWEAQTPQIFATDLLKEAFHAPVNKDYDAVDDASLVERIGHTPQLVMGSYSNIKLTTIEDLHIAQSLFATV